MSSDGFLMGLGNAMQTTGKAVFGYGQQAHKEEREDALIAAEKLQAEHIAELKHGYAMTEREFTAGEQRKTAEFKEDRADDRQTEKNIFGKEKYEAEIAGRENVAGMKRKALKEKEYKALSTADMKYLDKVFDNLDDGEEMPANQLAALNNKLAANKLTIKKVDVKTKPLFSIGSFKVGGDDTFRYDLVPAGENNVFEDEGLGSDTSPAGPNNSPGSETVAGPPQSGVDAARSFFQKSIPDISKDNPRQALPTSASDISTPGGMEFSGILSQADAPTTSLSQVAPTPDEKTASSKKVEQAIIKAGSTLTKEIDLIKAVAGLGRNGVAERIVHKAIVRTLEKVGDKDQKTLYDTFKKLVDQYAQGTRKNQT